MGLPRYWVAEHHGVGAAIAGSAPEVLMTRIACATRSIRVGSGSALLNYTTPLRLAETFNGLAANFPRRIDLGIGRASSPPVIDAALRQTPLDPWAGPAGDGSGAGLDAMGAWIAHEGQVVDVLDWLDGHFRPDDPRSRVRLVQGTAPGPEPWLLGSSLSSAMLASRLGLPYGFAAFFNPSEATSALRMYRACFTPSRFSSAPLSILAVNACCAPDEAAASLLRSSVELFYSTGGDTERRPLVQPDQAVAELENMGVDLLARGCETAVPGSRMVTRPLGTGRSSDGEAPSRTWQRHLCGAPLALRSSLQQFAAEAQADEIMIQDLIAEPASRLRSYQLIAEAFGTTDAGGSNVGSRRQTGLQNS